MSLPVRAYLFIRGADGDIAVRVCRDLAMVHADWEGLSQGSKHSTGMLHVGFDRPLPTEFEVIAKSYPGRMLLTSSAKFGLPASYHSSQAPVGKINKTPVYLGTRGWGYEIDDPTIVADTQSQYRPEGWVANYLDERSVTFPLFRNLEIVDDASYLQLESQLPNETRHDAGVYRFVFLRGCSSVGWSCDPCRVAAASPPWLLDRPLDSLGLPSRAQNALKSRGLQIVADIQSISINELVTLRNFGSRSRASLCEALNLALNEGPTGKGNAPKSSVHVAGEGESVSGIFTDQFRALDDRRKQSATSDSFEQKIPGDELTSYNDNLLELVRSREEVCPLGVVEEISRFLAELPDRDRDVISRRIGWGTEEETLQEIANRHCISRERVRQIERREISAHQRTAKWPGIFTQKVLGLISERDAPLPAIGIEVVDPWFSGIGKFAGAVVRLLHAMDNEPQMFIVKLDGIEYLSEIPKYRIDDFLTQAREFLESLPSAGTLESQCKTIVYSMVDEKAREFREFVWREASRYCHFVEDGYGDRLLVSYGQGAESAVKAVLLEAERPLHYSEISERVSKRTERDIDIRRAHNAAAEVGILLGRGVYGTDQHIKLTEEQITAIRESAEDIVISGIETRQWHSSEILSEMIDREIPEADDIDKYKLDHILKSSANLDALGRMVWQRKSDRPTSSANRIELRQAVASILEDAGQPLHTNEIKERLKLIRGVNQYFQMVPIDPVIRVGEGTWGLNDRDVAIKRAIQPAVMGRLVRMLSARGEGIHLSEIPSIDLFRNRHPSSAYLIFSLASQDERLQVDYGQNVFLREWGHSRRQTLSGALKKVFLESARPQTLSDLVRKVGRETGRAVERRHISASLQAIGAVFDPITERWTYDESSSNEENEEVTA